MAVDANGKNLANVGVPLTGNAAILDGSKTFTVPTNSAFGGKDFKVPTDFVNLGLRPEDGAPEWSTETDGDPIKFYETGYEIPNGQATTKCVMTLAETSPLIIELQTGQTLDANGVAVLDLSGNAKKYWLYTEDTARSVDGSRIVQRRLGEVVVSNLTVNKPEKGKSVQSYEVEFKLLRSDQLDGDLLYAQLTVPAGAGASGSGVGA